MPRLMRTLRYVLLLGALSAPADARIQRPSSPITAPQEIQVLFIGNSYTAANNLAALVAAVAGAQPGAPVMIPKLAVRGGATLEWHVKSGAAPDLLKTPGWHDVVIQEQSLLGGGADGRAVVADPGPFYGAVRELVKRARRTGATPVLFMTWARRDAPQDQPLLERAYLTIGRELGVKVARVGSAFAEARKRLPSLDLYAGDGSHPNWQGSYLAACVIAATLTGRDPRGAPTTIAGYFVDRRSGEVDRTQAITLVDLDPQTAAQLQAIAWETVSHKR